MENEQDSKLEKISRDIGFLQEGETLAQMRQRATEFNAKHPDLPESDLATAAARMLFGEAIRKLGNIGDAESSADRCQEAQIMICDFIRHNAVDMFIEVDLELADEG